jgi:hypothetical protein
VKQTSPSIYRACGGSFIALRFTGDYTFPAIVGMRRLAVDSVVL